MKSGVILALCVFSVSVMAQQPPSDSTRERSVRRAADLDMGVATLTVLRSMAPDEGHAVYKMLPADVRAEMWRSRIDAFESDSPSLTDGQRGVIARLRTLIDSGFFERGDDEALWHARFDATVHAIEADAREVFDNGDASALLAHLDRQPRDREGAQSRFPAKTTLVSCTCSTESDWCDGSILPTGVGTCKVPRQPFCLATPDGCGTFWQYGCNGNCT